MTTTRTFPSDSGQAVLLPDHMAYDAMSLELNIVREGDIIMIYPAQAMARRETRTISPAQPAEEAAPATEPLEAPEHAWD